MGSFILCWFPFFFLYSLSPVCPVCEDIADNKTGSHSTLQGLGSTLGLESTPVLGSTPGLESTPGFESTLGSESTPFRTDSNEEGDSQTRLVHLAFIHRGNIFKNGNKSTSKMPHVNFMLPINPSIKITPLSAFLSFHPLAECLPFQGG